MLGPEYDTVADAIPNDHARPSDSVAMLHAAAPGPAARVLDFGCGDGQGIERIRSVDADARYTGVDIETSPEVDVRSRTDAAFATFDGVNLPFDDRAFDVVYTHQVFEHVRHPDAAVADIFRVLRPGGAFVGTVSCLEPYHSYSVFNFTHWGLWRVLTEAGLVVRTLRPGIEGARLVTRQLTLRRTGGPGLAYPLIEAAGRLRGWDARRRNYLKLRFAGHIAFHAVRPE